jgi:hypothetical protein
MQSVTWFENDRSLVTDQRYWFLDTTTDTIYYYPEPGDDLSSARIPVRDTLMTVTGVQSNLTFIRITFTDTTWTGSNSPENVGYTPTQSGVTGHTSTRVVTMIPAAVLVVDSDGVSFEGCTFKRLGGSGIWFKGSQGPRVVACDFEDVSGHGIADGDVTQAGDADSTNLNGAYTYSCFFTGCGSEFLGCSPYWGAYLTNAVFVHNHIANAPWSAVAVGWGWGKRNWVTDTAQPPGPVQGNNLFAHNKIMGYGRELNDRGGFYLNNRSPGTAIRDNYVVCNIVNVGGPYYWDNGAAETEAFNNVADKCSGTWMVIQYFGLPFATENHIHDNWADSGDVNGGLGYDPSNTIEDNAIGALPPQALAIRDAAGRVR